MHSSSFLLTRYFSKEHEWVLVEKNVGTIGITEHAASQLGDVVFCELPKVGYEFEQGNEIGVIESVKAVSDIFAPVSGKVVEVNEAAVEACEIISEHPLDDGWLCKVELTKTSELDGLMNAEEYDKLIKDE